MIGNMRFKQTPLHRRFHPRFPRHVQVLLLVLAVVAPVTVRGVSDHAAFEQDFIITAYYSPLPGQCCYVMGGERADKILNGEGMKGADGSEVHPGMIAAPSSYPFGTIIVLPGLGRFTVHDRGGAIQELEGGAHRLDIWVGEGEEGLARALTFGVQRIHGTVYPVGGAQPQEKFSLENLPASLDRLSAFDVTGKNLMVLAVRKGDQSHSVERLQEALRKLGYLDRVTGFFGESTVAALAAFQMDYHIDAIADVLTEKTAAYLMAALQRQDASAPVPAVVSRDSSPSAIRSAQRTLRFFGFYAGRTDGRYTDELFSAILRFQQVKGLVGTAEDPGAGRVGPLTRGKITEAWNRRLVASIADRLLVLRRVETVLDQRGKAVNRFLEVGDGGDQVTLLQRLLSEHGFFPADKINGNFGPLTQEAVLKYQLAKKLIPDERSTGAGSVGPQTLRALRSDERLELYRVVRAQGWRAL